MNWTSWSAVCDESVRHVIYDLELFEYRTKALGIALRTASLPRPERARGQEHGGKAEIIRRLFKVLLC
jgi:hypothetical protein